MPNTPPCPKCGSTNTQKHKNQEHHCNNCDLTFYFVTPNTGNQHDLTRYDL
ncbi:MAG: hypothetical protein NWF04_02395 [Candidatus Bathyarchaeota archaeon]|nr:hypothetical protein [Candidatus Bathyarchaeota archaeon]